MSGGAVPLLLGARLCLSLLAVVIFGWACFSIYAPAELRPRENAAIRIGAPVLAAVWAVVWIGLLGRDISGSRGPPDPALMVRLCIDTGFGRALSAAALLCALLVVAGAGAPGNRWLRAALSAALLASLAFVGHAAAGVGVSGGLRQAVIVVHLLAAGAWLGGLPPLALALRKGRPATPVLLDRFGAMALLAVMLLLASGLASLLYMMVAAGGRLGPAYGRTLSAKLVIVGGLLVIAAVNRLWFTPRAHRALRPALWGLNLSLLLEQALALGLLAVTVLLGQLDPSM